MRGFSLLELIVAITVLGTGILGAVALINRTISAGSTVRDQFIAAVLAQEGMEVVHNIRNTNWVKGASDGVTLWGDGLVEGNSCVNFDSTSLISPGTCGDIDPEERRLYIFDDGFSISYTHTPSATPSIFSRYINIVSGDDRGTPYKLVNSTVLWANTSISVEERLYDWK